MARPKGPRSLAALKGEITYDQGVPCSYGHDGVRYTSNGMCVECLKTGDGVRETKHRSQVKNRYLRNHRQIRVPIAVSYTFQEMCALLNVRAEEPKRSKDGQFVLFDQHHVKVWEPMSPAFLAMCESLGVEVKK